MAKFFLISIISFVFLFSTPLISSAGRLFIGMTKKEAFDVEGVPYRVKRIQGEEGKEMWVYRCNNDDGFDEDCLYLYFSGDELRKIERP